MITPASRAQQATHIIASSTQLASRSCNELGCCQRRIKPCEGCHWQHDAARRMDALLPKPARDLGIPLPDVGAGHNRETLGQQIGTALLIVATLFSIVAVVAYTSGALGRMHGFW